MKRLAKIYSGLGRLRALRSTVRLTSAGSWILSILLWTLAVAYLLDFWIRMARLSRGILLVVAVVVVGWALVRYLLPAMRVRESDTALAVLVDQRQGMQSDLVGAIQFEDAARRQYGSAELREAVIDYIGAAGGSMDFLGGFSPEARRRLFLRLIVFAITAGVCAIPIVMYPAHTAAFLNRRVRHSGPRWSRTDQDSWSSLRRQTGAVQHQPPPGRSAIQLHQPQRFISPLLGHLAGSRKAIPQPAYP